MVIKDIEAFKIDKTHIYIKCPYCFTKYKKNGQPYKTAKNLIHLHGSTGDLTNRIETRSHHSNTCNNNFTWNIAITDNTIRSQ